MMTDRLLSVAQIIRDAGAAGMTTAQIAGKLGMTRKAAYSLIQRAMTAKLVRSRPAPSAHCKTTLAWVSTGSPPAVKPRPIPSLSQRSFPVPLAGAYQVGVPIEHRFTVRELPEGYVSQLNPAECRPWAREVAA